MQAHSMSAARAEPTAAKQDETTSKKHNGIGGMAKKKNPRKQSHQHLTFDTPLAMCSSPKSATDGNTGLQRELLPLATAVDP